jgi:PAS domain S-box-containing protein
VQDEIPDGTAVRTPATLNTARLIEQVVDYAIIALDGSGTIESWNAGAERLTGYTSDEAIGDSFSMFYPEEDRRPGLPLRLLDEARRDGRVEYTGWRVRKDGSRFWGHVVISAIRDDEGRLTGFAKVTRDLTERRELEEAQAAFLATFAHDFRTPIAAMKGFTELVLDAPDDKREEFLLRIDANADRLMQMMQDLVGYATLSSTSTARRPELFDLSALTRSTVATMGGADELARVSLPRNRALVMADKASMERVVINLVDNALKYSTAGPISVDVTRAESMVRLTVADQGRGIAEADLEKIFEEFERGSLAADDDGGIGLGLASVKSLVEEQGGRVSIVSSPGDGTTVTVEVPAHARTLVPA